MGMFWFKNRKRSNLFGKSPSSLNIKERESERINCELPILFANHETGEIAKGSALNYSKSGLYIETEHHIFRQPKVGKGALVYMTEYSPQVEGPNNLQKYYVQVKWIEQISEAENKHRYRIGVKHCSSYDDMLRLFA